MNRYGAIACILTLLTSYALTRFAMMPHHVQPKNVAGTSAVHSSRRGDDPLALSDNDGTLTCIGGMIAVRLLPRSPRALYYCGGESSCGTIVNVVDIAESNATVMRLLSLLKAFVSISSLPVVFVTASGWQLWQPSAKDLEFIAPCLLADPATTMVPHILLNSPFRRTLYVDLSVEFLHRDRLPPTFYFPLLNYFEILLTYVPNSELNVFDGSAEMKFLPSFIVFRKSTRTIAWLQMWEKELTRCNSSNRLSAEILTLAKSIREGRARAMPIDPFEFNDPSFGPAACRSRKMHALRKTKLVRLVETNPPQEQKSV